MNYDGRKFRVVSNSSNGETGSETVFTYAQNGSTLSGTYSGGVILEGHLLGTVLENGALAFVYHHINQNGEVMAGRCHSTPTFTAGGKLVLKEEWQWFTADGSKGQSEIEEI